MNDLVNIHMPWAPLNQPGGIPNTKVPEPSIRSRQLIIPLHFWFAENPGMALPLVSMQNSEVFINVTYRPLNQLFTIVDVNPSSSTYGQRIRSNDGLGRFLSPPLVDGTISNPSLSTFFPDPYLEGNFIYLTEMEMAQLATADQTFLVKTIKFVNNPGQYGGNSDIEIPFFNLVTRIVFSTQRSDKILTNDWDNYTNWDDPYVLHLHPQELQMMSFHRLLNLVSHKRLCIQVDNNKLVLSILVIQLSMVKFCWMEKNAFQ